MSRIEKNRSKSSRSRPVSCHFCRSRKLRCSRQFPCANCTSRGFSCQLEGPPSLSTLSGSSADEAPEQPSGAFQNDVLARLRRLEEIVIGQGEHTRTSPDQPGSQVGLSSLRHRGDITASFVENAAVVDVDWLERQITNPGSAMRLSVPDYEFKTCSVKDALKPTRIETIDPLKPNSTKYVWLPLYDESRYLVEKYLTEITYLHHVVHVPSVRALVDDFYQNLAQKKPIKLGQVTLLLAILASTTFFWTEWDMNKPVFSSVAQANGQSTIWMKIGLEILDYSRMTNSESLEDVQATIIIGFLVCNLVGIASQARYIFATATSTAWQLSLHRIDHPNNRNLDVPKPDSMRAEICRRVWWYLVATDWQISQVAGLQRGTYMINPQQMATNKPANANDEDLFDGMSNISMPIDQPTSMSYCVQRIRLGEICREISDSIPFLEIGPGDPHYEMIKHFDKRICEFAEGMPPFFSLDRDTHQLPDSDRHKSSGISIQRYIINSLLYTQRCRLHLPYLSRAASEPTYAYSRIACLEAARMIIRTEARLSAEKFPFVLTRFKFSGGLYCVCMAIIVLLMDLCQNKTMRPEDDRELRAETFQAFGILEEAQGHSPFAGKLLKSFHAIISRNKIPISTAENKLAGQPRTQSRSGRESTHNSTLTPVSTEAEMETTTIDASLPCFEDIWQTFDASVDPSTLFDWNALLSELDSPFLSI